jgi:hypothetical protein
MALGDKCKRGGNFPGAGYKLVSLLRGFVLELSRGYKRKSLAMGSSWWQGGFAFTIRFTNQGAGRVGSGGIRPATPFLGQYG